MDRSILVVEDDVSILVGLVSMLSKEGYVVSQATNGDDALRLYHQEKPEMILLDVMIPGMSGYDVCKEIRKDDPAVAIIMLTAKGEEVDKVVGLEMGADDYVVKPFSINELKARVRAVFRRKNPMLSKKIPQDSLSFGDVTVDPKVMKGTKGKITFSVTVREFQLLYLFTQHDGQVLGRDKILKEVWGVEYPSATRTLDQYILKLRHKIEKDPTHPQYILTVHGLGYRFHSGKR